MKQTFVTIALAALFVLSSARILAQMPEEEVRKRLDFIYSGQADRVRTELPELLQKHKNDAGARYLEALLTSDGSQAVRKYQAIVDQSPKSIWADDALYKVYQYYYSIGLYKTADVKMDELKKNYPNSIYVVGAIDTPVKESEQPAPAPATTPAAVLPAQKAVEKTEQKKEAPESQPAPAQNTKYAVQTGAFSTQQSAQKQIDFLAGIDLKGVLSTKQSGDKKLFVVTIEGFVSEKEARTAIADLQTKHNIASIIIIR
ncbi:MAG: SPOR domain-containing protein [Ignavibacteriales bacterium]|nr:SPOR domain-containing protein [Ignavibacteriales bacterium]